MVSRPSRGEMNKLNTTKCIAVIVGQDLRVARASRRKGASKGSKINIKNEVGLIIQNKKILTLRKMK